MNKLFNFLKSKEGQNLLNNLPKDKLISAISANPFEYMKGVNLMPGSSEYGYDPLVLTRYYDADDSVTPTSTEVYNYTINSDVEHNRSNFYVAIEQLKEKLPNNKQVNLLVAWYGDTDDLSTCRTRPLAENNWSKYTTRKADKVFHWLEQNPDLLDLDDWIVSNVTRDVAEYVSLDDDGFLNFGGTPSDNSIIRSVIHLIDRGQTVCFYPFYQIDIDTFPWRGYLGTPNDQTPQAEIDAINFFGTTNINDFEITETGINYIGSEHNHYTYRTYILHYAFLWVYISKQISEFSRRRFGVFYVGTELERMTKTRSTPDNTPTKDTFYPCVEQLALLIEDVKSIFDANQLSSIPVGYAANWSEYQAHQTNGGDIYFNMDRIWSTPANTAGLCFDNYFPIFPAAPKDEQNIDIGSGYNNNNVITEGEFQTKPIKRASSPYDVDYLMQNILGGEYYSYYYANQTDRDNQVRTTITDGGYGEHWLFRLKDFPNFISQPHHNRVNGVREEIPSLLKGNNNPQNFDLKTRFSELGTSRMNNGFAQPNVFEDPKSINHQWPYYSDGSVDVKQQFAFTTAYLAFAILNPEIINVKNIFWWTWDIRPYPFFPQNTDYHKDFANWKTGHWLNGLEDKDFMQKIEITKHQGLNFYFEVDSDNLIRIDGKQYIKHFNSTDKSLLNNYDFNDFDLNENSLSFSNESYITLNKNYTFKTYFLVCKVNVKSLNIIVGKHALDPQSYYSFFGNTYIASVDGNINKEGVLYINSINIATGKNIGSMEKMPSDYAVFAVTHKDLTQENSLLFKLGSYSSHLQLKAFLSYDKEFSENEVVETSNELMNRFNIT